MLTIRFIFMLLLLVPLPARCADMGGLTVIANGDFEVSAISQAEARLLFTGEIKTLDGVTVHIVTMKKSSELYARFVQEVLNLYPYQVERSIERKRYAGMSQVELSAGSSEEMFRMVANTPGAIGYMPRSLVSGLAKDSLGRAVRIVEVRHE